MSKSKDNDVSQAVLSYLRKQNRPYSVVDIFNNLHKEYGKTAVTRAAEELSRSGKIKEKTYGKQKIYFIPQDQYPDVDEAVMKRMEAEINNFTSTLKELQGNIKNNESLLITLNSSMTTSAIKSKIADLNESILSLESRLHQLRSNTKQVTKEEKNKVYSENEKYKKEWQKRKRMANDMLDAILEGYPKSKKMLFEEIGVETDEDANVKFPK